MPSQIPKMPGPLPRVKVKPEEKEIREFRQDRSIQKTEVMAADLVIRVSLMTSGDGDFQSLAYSEYDYQGEGRVVVEVSVDRSGKVIQATPGSKGSTTLDEYLLKVAKEAALKATFDPKADAPAVQKGTITYNFMLR